jgi:hypothetical protein
MLGLVILTLLALLRPATACKPPAGYPPDVPLIGCPRAAEAQLWCLRCLADQRSYRVYYAAAAKAVADDWAAALHAAGWTIKRSAHNGVPSIVADKAGQTLALSVFTGGTEQWKPYTPQLQGTMVFATFHR